MRMLSALIEVLRSCLEGDNGVVQASCLQMKFSVKVKLCYR